MPICLRLLMQPACRDFSRALAKTGKRIAASIAMIAMTTRSSIRVKAADLPARDRPDRPGEAESGIAIKGCDIAFSVIFEDEQRYSFACGPCYAGCQFDRAPIITFSVGARSENPAAWRSFREAGGIPLQRTALE